MVDGFQVGAGRLTMTLEIQKQLDNMEEVLQEVRNLLAGTYTTPGLVHRVASLETQRKTAWWSDRGTKAVDALVAMLLVSGLVVLLHGGLRATLREMLATVPAPPVPVRVSGP